MGEGSGRCRVGKVVCRYVYRLNGGDGTVLRGCDAFLHCTHFGCERRLVSYGRRHTSEQCGNFRSGLCKTEDVVNKEQNISGFACIGSTVAEGFGNRQTGKCHAGTCTWGFVHLSVYKGGLRLVEFLIVYFGEVPFAALHGFFKLLAVFYDTGFNHFAEQVVTFACTFADSGKHGETVVAFRDVIDKLHNEHGLTHTGSSKESDFTALHARLKQVNDLDAGV